MPDYFDLISRANGVKKNDWPLSAESAATAAIQLADEGDPVDIIPNYDQVSDS